MNYALLSKQIGSKPNNSFELFIFLFLMRPITYLIVLFSLLHVPHTLVKFHCYQNFFSQIVYFLPSSINENHFPAS